MDARKYASKYVKPDNVRDGPIQTRIVNVFEEERYGRLCSSSKPAPQFPLNDGNTNVLIKAWGHDTDDWIGQEGDRARAWAPTRIGAPIRRRKKKRCGCAPSRRREATAAERRRAGEASRRCRRAGRSPSQE